METLCTIIEKCGISNFTIDKAKESILSYRNDSSRINDLTNKSHLIEESGYYPFSSQALFQFLRAECGHLSQVKGEIKLYRGLNSVPHKPGDILTTLGHMSTSIHPKSAAIFASQKANPAFLVLTVNLDTNLCPKPLVDISEIHHFDAELEFLVSNGNHFIIKKIEYLNAHEFNASFLSNIGTNCVDRLKTLIEDKNNQTVSIQGTIQVIHARLLRFEDRIKIMTQVTNKWMETKMLLFENLQNVALSIVNIESVKAEVKTFALCFAELSKAFGIDPYLTKPVSDATRFYNGCGTVFLESETDFNDMIGRSNVMEMLWYIYSKIPTFWNTFNLKGGNAVNSDIINEKCSKLLSKNTYTAGNHHFSYSINRHWQSNYPVSHQNCRERYRIDGMVPVCKKREYPELTLFQRKVFDETDALIRPGNITIRELLDYGRVPNESGCMTTTCKAKNHDGFNTFVGFSGTTEMMLQNAIHLELNVELVFLAVFAWLYLAKDHTAHEICLPASYIMGKNNEYHNPEDFVNNIMQKYTHVFADKRQGDEGDGNDEDPKRHKPDDASTSAKSVSGGRKPVPDKKLSDKATDESKIYEKLIHEDGLVESDYFYVDDHDEKVENEIRETVRELVKDDTELKDLLSSPHAGIVPYSTEYFKEKKKLLSGVERPSGKVTKELRQKILAAKHPLHPESDPGKLFEIREWSPPEQQKPPADGSAGGSKSKRSSTIFCTVLLSGITLLASFLPRKI